MSKGLFSADETLAGWFDDEAATGLFDADLLDAWFATLVITESDDSLTAATLATVGAAAAIAEADDTLAAAVAIGLSAASPLTDVSDAIPGTYWAPGYWSSQWWSATWWALRIDGPASVLVVASTAQTDAADSPSADASLAVLADASGTEVDSLASTLDLGASIITADAALTEDPDSLDLGATVAIAADLASIEADDSIACDVLTGAVDHTGWAIADLEQTDADDDLVADGAVAFLPTQSTGIVSWHYQKPAFTPIRGPHAPRRPKVAPPILEALSARADVHEDDDRAVAVSRPQIRVGAAVDEDADQITAGSGTAIRARVLRFERPDALTATARVDWSGQIAAEDRLLELGADLLMAEWLDEAA